MRILHIHFKNLNSLVGAWEIDLTDPVFAANGIFAITGPTGAGKTTILDAICLALYGCTPRLGSITKRNNEILSRQCGACHAEVTFETQSGRYRCHWSQHRARNKPNGELQAPKHELSNAESREILDSTIQGVAKKIEKITGMNFEQFTRSILLAQGEFAAFLQAKPADRAVILEQITGKTIYTEISKHVHKRCEEEKKEVGLLLKELDRIALLSEEEIQHAQATLEKNSLQDAVYNQEITKTNQAIAWLDGIAKRERAIEAIKAEREAWKIRQAQFAPKRVQLQRANQALELACHHVALTAIRQAEATDRQNRERARLEKPACLARQKSAEEAMQQAVQAQEARRAEQKAALPIIQQVRALDLQRREKEIPIQALRDALVEQKKQQDALRTKQARESIEREQKEKERAQTVQQLAETQGDAGLVEALTGIVTHFDALKSLHTQQTNRRKEVETARIHHAESDQQLQKASAQQIARQQEQDANQQTFTQAEERLKTLLDGHDLTEWRQTLFDLQEKKRVLDGLAEAVRLQAEASQSMKAVQNRREALESTQQTLATTLPLQQARETALEEKKELLEKQRALLLKIQSFETVRHQLQDGEPCPLCGATVHPFKSDQPVFDETEVALREVGMEIKKAREEVAQSRMKQVAVNQELEQRVNQGQEQTTRMTTVQAQIAQCYRTLAMEGSDEERAVAWPSLQVETVQQLDQLTARLRDADMLEKNIAALRITLEKSRESTRLAERAAQSAIHQKEQTGQLLARLEEEAKQLEARLQEMLETVQQRIAPYGVDTLSLDRLDLLSHALTARRDQWREREQKRMTLERQIATLTQQRAYQQAQLAQQESTLLQQQAQIAAGEQALAQLRQARQALLGDTDPEQEEQRLVSAMEEAERQVAVARQAVSEATQAVVLLTNRLEDLERKISARAEPLQEAEAHFSAQLNLCGFSDEPAYLVAVLPEESRKTLTEEAQQLENEETALNARDRDQKEELARMRQALLTEQSREDLDQAMAQWLALQKVLQQETGAIQQKLAANETRKEAQQAFLQQVEAQKQEYARWKSLDDLIGSADGGTYRNFAQGLTFDRMIGHANRQLQKMTDRYLLIRNDTLLPDLDVIDTYQAGEQRSTKNLSGGESFIVSLSLALGLSHMASNNVRVDSLFLDEGFGTLDEEALETALGTLSSLHREGKLIGIISHVPALKERVQAQIEITPQRGGRSTIRGPGCRKVG